MGRKKTAPPTKTIRIHEDVYDEAMIVAAFKRKDLTTYLTETLRPIVHEELRLFKAMDLPAKLDGSAKN